MDAVRTVPAGKERGKMKKGIVEIEMPENCFECPLRYDAVKMSIGPYEYRQMHRCLLQPDDVEDVYLRDISRKRQEWCPLKEIPDKAKKEADGLYRKWQILNDVIPLEKALKPCRMCGGNYITAKHRAFGGYKAKCMSCECEVRAETILDLVELWNGEKL